MLTPNMKEILFYYKKVDPMIWVYFSSLLTIALYFKFSRLWSLRNLDLICLILLAPGLVLEVRGRELAAIDPTAQTFQNAGYIWLFAVGGILLIRLLLDPMMVRRPLLEPNLTVGGMTFLGASLLVFLMANVATVNPSELLPEGGSTTVASAPPTKTAPAATNKEEATSSALPRAPVRTARTELKRPGYPLLWLFPSIPTQSFFAPRTSEAAELAQYPPKFVVASRTIVILSHLAAVAGLVLIGYWHFDNIKTGVAAAVLYLMLPYMAEMTGRPEHALPAAFLVWAVAMYRQPIVAGIFIGLAAGTIYFPLFLLPLWISFYWQRGLWRFCLGMVVTVAILVGVLALRAGNLEAFTQDVKQMFGLWFPLRENLEGFWRIPGIKSEYRWPVLALFVVLATSFALWPAQKNLGTLMSCTAALMLAAQFWHPNGGGLFMAWYLPLLLLTVFRPNLEDRVSLAVVGEGWIGRRGPPAGVAKAA